MLFEWRYRRKKYYYYYYLPQAILGKLVKRPSHLDEKLVDDLMSCPREDDGYVTVRGKTMCTLDFYEGNYVMVNIFIVFIYIYLIRIITSWSASVILFNNNINIVRFKATTHDWAYLHDLHNK